MAKRVSTKVISNVSIEDAQAASNEYASGQTKLEKIEARMNEEINKIKAKYLDEITDIKESIEEPYKILEVFAKEQKSEWGKRKSYDLLHSIIGFRTGTPKVVKDKKFTWDAVLELLKKNKLFKPFIRTTEEINKDAILQEKNEATLKTLKDECFIEVDQDEKFFIQVKKEEVAA